MKTARGAEFNIPCIHVYTILGVLENIHHFEISLIIDKAVCAVDNQQTAKEGCMSHDMMYATCTLFICDNFL